MPELVHMILTIGNSHDEGRATARSTDAFREKVWQWTQAGTLLQSTSTSWPTGPAMLDHQDPATSAFSPDIRFASDYLTANPTVDRLVFVPNGHGGTAFFTSTASLTWSAANAAAGNLLSDSIARFNAARTHLIGLGHTVVVAGVLFHVANPDYGRAEHVQAPGWDIHREAIDEFVAYLRANLDGATASTPIAIGGGMNKEELDARTDQNDRLYQANLLGSAKRSDYVGSFDPINPRYGYSTGLPVPQKSATDQHATRTGDITLGHLRYQALVRAQANAACHAPFSGLSFFSPSTITALWDFRTGSPQDISGNGNHLIRYDDTNPPLYLVDVKSGANPALDELAWTRASGATRQVHQVPMALPAQYTISVYQRFASFDAAMAFLQRADAPTDANDTRFQYSHSNDDIRAGHGTAASTVKFARGSMNTTSFYLLTLTFDGTTMKLYLDGTLKDSHSSAAHASVPNSYLGAASASAGNPLVGTMAFAMVCSRALTATEVGELSTAAQSLLAP
ncbi:LamG domain-containing protein [Sphingomonas canadensis]|uniref:LamG domain-containing protein n=1 Tax=Sphingomonas canadensis TaxID=1219257 RepID=A0ABW3H5T3_9SPHN|nr:LamG domain-containing protein [Sphingomonas canadensis]MCW3836217.1 LamG domain-containing protein [Sphingomonas canadensis]